MKENIEPKFTRQDWERIIKKLALKIKELSKTESGRKQIKRAVFKIPKAV